MGISKSNIFVPSFDENFDVKRTNFLQLDNDLEEL
jgi:hypothetical protein